MNAPSEFWYSDSCVESRVYYNRKGGGIELHILLCKHTVDN